MVRSSLSRATEGLPSTGILLVEDDPGQCKMVGGALAMAGCVVLEAGNPHEAEQYLASSVEIDILMTDIDLHSQLNGIHLVYLARHYRPQIPALVVSGRGPELFDAQRFSSAEFLRKPFTRSSLISSVTRLIGNTAGFNVAAESAEVSHP